MFGVEGGGGMHALTYYVAHQGSRSPAHLIKLDILLPCWALLCNLNNLKKFPNVFGGHHISMNMPCKREKGYYYIHFLPLLKSRHKKLCDLHRFGFLITFFTLCVMMRKSPWVKKLPNFALDSTTIALF
jgi:hypothetical protein